MAKTKVHGEYLKDSVVRFTAKAGENITKGQAVYISGISGEVSVVSLADANDTAKMPAFGLAEATVSTNAEVEITSFGTLKGLDTSSFSLGDILYVDTTAGSLTNNPSGLEATKLQNIGIVQRVHASSGSIKVGGAGRTNAVPNLDDGDIFIGDSNNKAVSDSFTNVLNTEAGINSSANATAITIDSSENVGIGTPPSSKLHVVGSEVLFDNTGGDFTLKLNTNAVSDKNEIIMGDTVTPLAKFGVGGTANDIITGSDGQDFNIGTGGGGRAINFSTDNYASVEMKFDGGNLLVGGTSPEAANSTTLYNTGQIVARSSNGLILELRTDNASGEIISFRNNAGQVGSIGTQGSSTYIAGASTGLRFAGANILPSNSAGAFTDNTSDLGGSTERFKDLYLSGGAYLGGTGSANHLDDYETGFWTPVLSGSGYSFGTHTGVYVKVGRMVYVTALLSITTVGTNTSIVDITGYPFLSLNFGANHQVGTVRQSSTTGRHYVCQINVNNTSGGMNSMDGISSGDNEIFTTGNYSLSMTYMTN